MSPEEKAAADAEMARRAQIAAGQLEATQATSVAAQEQSRTEHQSRLDAEVLGVPAGAAVHGTVPRDRNPVCSTRSRTPLARSPMCRDCSASAVDSRQAAAIRRSGHACRQANARRVMPPAGRISRRKRLPRRSRECRVGAQHNTRTSLDSSPTVAWRRGLISSSGCTGCRTASARARLVARRAGMSSGMSYTRPGFRPGRGAAQPRAVRRR